MKGKLLVIGFGPGSFEHITKRAREAIGESDVIIGYNTYVDLIRDLLTDQEIVRTGMTEEVSRAQEAVKQAESGKKVAVISSGDAGVYGMAGLIYEVLIEKGWSESKGVGVEVIPGISAINSCASLLGAPIMHDACTISLSDHLTPWELIEKRIEAAGAADFVIALYNPRSGKRTRQIIEAQNILLKYRSPDTPVGLVKSAYREREFVQITTLEKMLEFDIGMLTTVIIGNSTTFLYDGKMITPRGYQRKYTLDRQEQQLKPHERLKKENEPWSLSQEEVLTDENQMEITPLALASEALQTLQKTQGNEFLPNLSKDNVNEIDTAFQQESILEFAVSPGIANKKFTSGQMKLIAEIAGDKGDIEYTPHHQIILRVSTSNPNEVTSQLKDEGLLLAPIGDVAQVKACDFCDEEKDESIPYVKEIHKRIEGLKTPKELKIGFNGCAMACYGAVKEDIGIVFRKGKFDLFLGAKTVGRTAHAAQPVAEGIEKEHIVDMVERIVKGYANDGFPNERFHKYFKRLKEIEGFTYRDVPVLVTEQVICGD
ncbi:precorrin-3B C(17)-methyltransferase [Chengkuizengella axinellae]|uniref:Precorrin-3B C(17)-methyltransferase n=1 Tax=Chengkuizengella axinellae TaxID=3064388 RepID=A0ABT9IXU1_9BACL|nr:precorrin-3B C(17)-methyltransferase [Chengkuizengella sp. 2205SS18-9]MDP5274171.1 precorrin-3B C(17)-methyltransferase [Chengkuizengella sp. 2205SS18-9]